MDATKISKLFDQLLKDKHFICRRNSPKGIERYCVYSNAMQPLIIISRIEMRYLGGILVEKNKKWYLSRKAIRSLHGNNILRRIYLEKVKGLKEAENPQS
jgi:hypothetical protein